MQFLRRTGTIVDPIAHAVVVESAALSIRVRQLLMQQTEKARPVPPAPKKKPLHKAKARYR